MTKAFYSFHFSKDVFRAGQVRNIGAVEGDQIVDDNSWEQVKKKGDEGIKNWIDLQMKSCNVVIVLVGEETASRKWVDYEIRAAWDSGKPLFGIRINGLKSIDGKTSVLGANPFETIGLQNGNKLSSRVPLHTPNGVTSQEVYANIGSNIKTWIKNAPARKT